jgi:hypothetical protein
MSWRNVPYGLYYLSKAWSRDKAGDAAAKP